MIILYRIICQTNSKIYVGQTSRPLTTRFQEHISHAIQGMTTCRKLYAAIRKHGKENFYAELLSTVETEQDANQLEKFYISQFNSIKNGYNLQEGGYNGKPSEETRKLMSESRLGEKNGMFGKSHTTESKNQISLKKKGQPSFWKGKTIPQEVRDKISDSRKGITVGEKNPSAKLTKEQVEEIKLLLQNPDYTQKQIWEMFNISRSQLQRIKSGKSWK